MITTNTTNRAAILTYDALAANFARLQAMAASFVLTGEMDRARSTARQALRAHAVAVHFAKSEGLR